MSNDFDDATQLGSIGHNPSVPSQPGQQQPAGVGSGDTAHGFLQSLAMRASMSRCSRSSARRSLDIALP